MVTYRNGSGIKYRAGGQPASLGHFSYRGGWGQPGSVSLYPVDQEEDGQRILTARDILTSQTLDPKVCLFFGRRGDGKTLSMTAVGKLMDDAYKLAGKHASKKRPDGFKIAANYHVKFASFCNPMLVDMLAEFHEQAEKMLALVDEILSYIPSRRTMARSNLNIATFLTQIRKRDIELLCTTQFPQHLDGQMLEQINLLIMPILYHRKNSVRLLIWDWWGQYTGKMWPKRWPPMMSGEPPDFTLDIHGLHSLFPLFSTKEIVSAMWASNRGELIDRYWGADLDSIVEEHAPDAVALEHELPPPPREPRTLVELAAGAGDNVRLGSILNTAKGLDSRIKTPRDLAEFMEGAGYAVFIDGRQGYRAVRNPGPGPGPGPGAGESSE